MKPRIAYTKPSITELEVSYATDAARTGWGERCYDYINRFEKAFAAHLGTDHAIATSSCTGALHMGLAALGVGPGDEVILADTNWIASVAPVVYLGAKPVLVDIDPDTWCLSPEKVKAAITPRTKAILAVHLYGNVCDLTALGQISNRYGLHLIEDAAEALGSTFEGRRAGTFGCFSTFSLHGSKTITTGEGGMFATHDKALYEKVLTLSNHGRSRTQTKQFWPDTIGFKYKMSNIQAAIGLGQMERIDELIARRQDILARYKRALAEFDSIAMNPEPPGGRNGAWMPTVVFDTRTGVTREILFDAFSAENIDARVFFYPLSSLPMFDRIESNVTAYDIPGRAINLPSYHDMSDEDISRVVGVVKSVMHAIDHPSRDYIIWGSKGHALVLADMIRLMVGRVIALIDNDPAASSVLPGVPLFIGEEGLRRALKGLEPASLHGLAAIGGGSGAARREIHAVYKSLGMQVSAIVHPRSNIADSARIGAGTHVMAGATIASAAVVGADCIINHGANVDHECEIDAGCHIAPGATLCGCVKVGENVFVGAGAVILPRLRLDDGCVIGAGSVVTRSVASSTTVAGNPARPLDRTG